MKHYNDDAGRIRPENTEKPALFESTSSTPKPRAMPRRRRKKSQLERVRDLMLDGQRRTPYEIIELLGGGISESSITAKLRALRKIENGGYDVCSEKRRGQSGSWEYWIEIGGDQ